MAPLFPTPKYRRLVAGAALLGLWASGSAQTKLNEFLQQHPVQPGPMIVLEPERVKSEMPAKSLADFHRVVTKVGALSVIAPSDMTLIDETFSQAPDFYEGLDRNAKIMYLMTLLSDSEWASIASQGLSAADLRGEARDVMESILPHPLRWTAWGLGAKVDSGTVADDQHERVRLRLVRGLKFTLNVSGQPNTTTIRFSADQPGADGDVVYQREDDAGQLAPFGLRPLRVVPNKPKASQLDYALPALDVPIDMPKTASISEVLRTLQERTGVELCCDFRVANKTLSFAGAQSRAGDLLQGIALTITGTYRKIGPAYELTSDLSGIGARKVKFAIWEASARREMERRMSLWRAAIGESGHLSQIRFPANSRFGPNAEMQIHLDRADGGDTDEMMSSNDMTDWARDFLTGMGQKIDPSQAKLETQLEFQFVLPDGQALRPEPGLMTISDYREASGHAFRAVSRIPLGPYSMTALNSSNSTRAAIAEVGDPLEARWLVDLLHRFSFKEIWLEATRPEVVEAAAERCKEYGIALRLQVRPWAMPGDTRSDDEDATILGDRGDRLADRERALDVWNVFNHQTPQPSPNPYRTVSPEASSTFSRWALVSQLARIPGVSGVVLEDLQPYGYEGKRAPYMHSGLEKSMGEMSDLGYSVKQRLEFLRANSLDPIDTVGDDLDLRIELCQPFFPDNATGLAPASDPLDSRLTQLVAAWDKMRAASVAKAATALIDCLPKDLPLGILVSPPRPAINDRGPLAVEFEDSSVYFPSAPARNASPFLGLYRFEPEVKDDPTMPVNQSLYGTLVTKGPICLDFRDVSLSDMAKILDKNFMQVMSIKITQIDRP